MKIKLLIILSLLNFISFSQSQDSTGIKLNEVRIEGIRASKDYPIPQTTIKRVEIQKFHQGYEVSQLLDDTPSITSSSDGGHQYGYTSFRIRGIDQTRINMTLNGVPLNESEDQGVYFSNYPNFLESISSFQIQRGVGTSTNGVSSYGGSINFIGNTGRVKEVTLKTTAGSYGTRLVNAAYGSGNLNNFSYFTNISLYETDGYKYGSGGNGKSLYFGGEYNNINNIFRLTAFSGNSKNGMAWLPVSETDINNNPRTNYNKTDAWDDFNQTFIQLEYNHLFNSKSKLTSTVFYTKLKGEYDYYMVGKNYFFLDSDFYGLNTNYNKKYKNGELNLGVSGNTYSREHMSTFEYDLFKNTGYKSEGNLYTKLNHNIGSLTLFGDIQYRYVDFSYDGSAFMPHQEWKFFNPKAGFKVKGDDGLEIYGLVAQTHREPTRSNLFGGSDNFTALSNIVSEKVLDYELGVSVKDKKMDFNFNLYYMDFTNEITPNSEFGINSLPLFYNVDSSYRSGIEMNINYKLSNGFGVSYNGNFSQNGIKGTELVQLYSPEVIQNFNLNYQYRRISMSLAGKYHSISFIDVANQNTTPEFIIFNANLSYEYKQICLYFTLINLTNQEYYTNGSAVGGNKSYFVNTPLSFNTTLKISL